MKRPCMLTASAAEINAWNDGGYTDGTEITIEQLIKNVRSFVDAWNNSCYSIPVKEGKTND